MQFTNLFRYNGYDKELARRESSDGGGSCMLDSRYIIAYGLTTEESDYLRKCSEEIECEVLTARDFRDLMSTGHFLSVISADRLDKEAVVVLSEYFREVDGNLTIRLLLGQEVAGLTEAAHAEAFENFSELKGKLPELLSKASKKAKSAETTIHTLANIMQVRDLIENHPGITTHDLAKAIDKNEATIRRYIEILRIMRNQITYDSNRKTWSYRH